MKNLENILITGSSGLVGASLVKKLLNKNNLIVIIDHVINIEWKKKYKHIKIAQWFEDNLSENGPDPYTNKRNFSKYIEYLDHNFVTSDPKNLNLDKKFDYSYLPIPVDENIEYLKCYENKNPIKDIFFAFLLLFSYSFKD